jgi:hypothetical protein
LPIRRIRMKKGIALYEALIIVLVLGMVALVVFMATTEEKENKMNKFLRVTFSDGKVYDIPAEFIAKTRAEYYAKVDANRGENFITVYNKELKIALEDDSEIIDWAFNNMDWVDVITRAVLLVEQEPKIADYMKEWSNVKHEIVNK